MSTTAERRRSVADIYVDESIPIELRTTRALGNRFSVSHKTIVNDLRAVGVAARPPRRPAGGGLSIDERRRRVRELYATMTCAEIALELGCSVQPIKNDVRELGLESRQAAPRRRYPEPEARPCPFCGADFTPNAQQVNAGYGKWCTDDCYRASQAFRAAARAIEVLLAYDAGELGAEIAVAQSVSRDTVYRDLARAGARLRGKLRRTGRVVECASGSGRTRWVYASLPTRFLGHEAWARYRWKHGLGLEALVRSTFPGRARQRWLGRWEGIAAAVAARRAGTIGRPRSYTAEQENTAIEMKLRSPHLGERPIADRLGLKKRQVHEIFVRARALGRLT